MHAAACFRAPQAGARPGHTVPCASAPASGPKRRDGRAWGQNDPFPSQTYRPSEVLAAIARVQLKKIQGILAYQRELNRTFLEELDEARGYAFQYLDDPKGDTGVSASILVHDKELARGYALALEAEGVPAATIYNEGIPDRHIYADWDSVLNKTSPHPSGYPWKDPPSKAALNTPRTCAPKRLVRPGSLSSGVMIIYPILTANPAGGVGPRRLLRLTSAARLAGC